MASNEVRIIGGLWKGRKLRFPDVPGLRPTLGRVRETLFNWLGTGIRGARCLDLFAGSGALGFEALSRGAASVTFVERNRKAAAALRANIETLGADSAEVVARSAETYLAAARDRKWDVVFFDPPFSDDRALALLEAVRASLLAPEGLIYVERPRRSPLPLAAEMIKQSTAGECHFGLLPGKTSITNADEP
jgi:16S rRNA (guanine966-N2)-methyltransferase